MAKRTDLYVRDVPAVGPARPLVLPKVTTATLDNGLQVLVARRPGLPLVQLRILLPTSRRKVSAAERARQQVLGRTLLSGTENRSAVELAETAQTLGGGLSAGADVEDLSFSGAALASNVRPLLGLVGEVLTQSTFPAVEVANERTRIVQELAMARAQPQNVAYLALARAVYGDHVYAEPLADPDLVAKVTGKQLGTYLGDRVGPKGGVVVLVGDVQPARAIAAVDKALGGWEGGRAAQKLPVPDPPTVGPFLVIDRPGAVQTNIRMAGRAPGRKHADLPALTMANTILGGMFSARLIKNIREDKGYTYSPGSSVAHNIAASLFTVGADVGTEVTGPAMVEILYELGRMANLAVPADELEQARSDWMGTSAVGLQTQGGVANNLIRLASFGLSMDDLAEQRVAIGKVTPEEVLEVSSRYLAPGRLVTVLVGDAEKIVPSLETFGPVEVQAG